MATLEEVLAEMSDANYAHDDIQFMIDENLRTITIPSRGVVLGVVEDKDVNRVDFMMNRYYNGYDMSKFEIRVNYVNANGDRNWYSVKDIIVNEETIIFSWLVAQDATAYMGTVRFLVRMLKLDGGKILQDFHTTLAEATVLEGLSVEIPIDPDDAYDMLANLKNELQETVKAEQESAAKSASDAAKSAEESAEMLQNVRDAVADLAVTPTATGSQIVARDSAEWPLQALTVYGRTEQVKTTGAQLIDFSRAVYQRCTLVDADTGTIKSNINDEYFCTIDINYLSEYFFANLGKTFSFQTDNNPTGTDVIIVVYGERTSGNWFQSSTTKGTRTTITIAEDFTSIGQVELRVNRKAETFTDTTSLISGLMLYEGNEDKAFEPYTGGKPSPSLDYPQPIVNAGCVLTTGAQLLDGNNLEIGGINGGTGELVDTLNRIRIVDIGVTPGTLYTLSGYAVDYVLQSSNVFDADGSRIGWFTSGGAMPDGAAKLSLCFARKDGANMADTDLGYLRNHLMLNEGSTATTYEPYTGGVPAAYPVGIDVAVEGKNLFDISIRDLISSGYDVANATLISQTETGVVVQGNVGSSSGGDAGYNNGWYRPGNNHQSKNKLYLKKGTTVTVSADYTVLEFRYDNRTANQNRIGVHLFTYAGKQNYVGTNINIDTANKKYRVTKTFTITTEDGLAYYPVFSLNSNKVQIDNIQIEIGSTATPYEPYRGRQTITLATNGLPGIQVSDSESYADTIEYRNGQAVYVQRVWSKTFDGSSNEKWALYNSTGFEGFCAIDALPEKCNRCIGFCNLLTVHSDSAHAGEEGLWLGVGNGTVIYYHNSRFYDTSFADKGLANWKAYLAAHPMTVMTYLTTPIGTPLTAAEAAQLAALHTYKPTTTITNDAGVGMDVTYVADTKAYIDNKFAELQAAQATTNAQLI